MEAAKDTIFRAYDIRGVYGRDLTEQFAERLGKTLGTFFGEGKTIVVARDTRESGEVLKTSLTDGLTSVGCSVVDLGVFPTPAAALIVLEKRFDGAVVVSASHNTAEWNGFIPINSRGLICSEGFGMEEIREIFSNQNFTKSAKVGNVSELEATETYLNLILGKVKVTKKFRVVLDVRGGATHLIAPMAFSRAGCEVTTINQSVDGKFSGQKPDVTEECLSGLKKAVVEKGADVGLAFDADGDRAAFVDSKGRYCGSGNVTIVLFSEAYLRKYPHAKIVFDVCCSSFIGEFVKSKGGVPIVNRVGHSFIANRMAQEKAVFGGEYSNHLYFSDIYGLDDAIFAGLKLLEIVSASEAPLADLIDAIPKYPSTNVESISCPDEIKFEVVASLKTQIESMKYETLDLDGVKAFSENGGWFLIRASNTNPSIKVNAEGKTDEEAKRLHAIAVDLVKKEIARYPVVKQ